VYVWDLQTGPLAAIELDAPVRAVIRSGTDGLLVATDKGAVRLDLRL
jgi:hypothetical protein